jgi:hypothetical protein
MHNYYTHKRVHTAQTNVTAYWLNISMCETGYSQHRVSLFKNRYLKPNLWGIHADRTLCFHAFKHLLTLASNVTSIRPPACLFISFSPSSELVKLFCPLVNIRRLNFYGATK